MTPAERFCKLVAETPDMSNATARFGAWLLGVAGKTGGFPVELTFRQIRDGIEGVTPGLGGRYETFHSSIDWYQSRGLLNVTPTDRASSGGFTTTLYSLAL